MRRAAVFVLALAIVASPLAGRPAASAGSFDGHWAVTLTCEKASDGALGYVFQFPAEVKDGQLHGEHGIAGHPSWLAIDGQINSAGDAAILADGLTGLSDYNLGRVVQGAPYTYRIKAHFDGARGAGTRVSGARACKVEFLKV